MANVGAQQKGSQQPKVKFKPQELLEYIKNIVPDERVTASDLREPQPQKIQAIYLKLLRTVVGNKLDVKSLPESMVKTMFPEAYGFMPPATLRCLLRSLFLYLPPNLGFDDMTLMDLLQPSKSLRQLLIAYLRRVERPRDAGQFLLDYGEFNYS
jgi:hypothetical protein